MNLIFDMVWLFMGVVGSCELALRSAIPHHVSRLSRSVGKAVLRLSSARVSDHWKILVARRYAVDVLSSTLFVSRVLFTALAPVVTSFWLVSGSLDAVLPFALRFDVATILTIISVGYLYLRTRIRQRG